MIHRLIREQTVSASPGTVWEFFSTPRNLNRMTPPDMDFEIVNGGEGDMFAGQLIEYRVKFMPLLRTRWLTEITRVERRAYFVDEQRIGPYRFWHHAHRFDAVEGGTRIEDVVTYALPLGPLGDLVHALWIRRRLAAIFEFRRGKVLEIFGS